MKRSLIVSLLALTACFPPELSDKHKHDAGGNAPDASTMDGSTPDGGEHDAGDGDADTGPMPECTASKPCTDATKPRCADGTCVTCEAAADCTSFTDTPVCDTTSDACVACVADADCGDASLAKCDVASHSCVKCDANEQCAHVEGKGVCASGACVECTKDELSACKNADKQFACDFDKHECTEKEVGKTDPCGACRSDAECKTGEACVKMSWDVDGDGTAETELGWFCQWVKNGGGGAPVACATPSRPFTGQKDVVGSADAPDAMPTICTLRASTCIAHDAYGNPCGRFGTGPTSIIVENIYDPKIPGAPVTKDQITPDDSVCGYGGKCATKSADDGAYQCSVACGGSDGQDCPSEFQGLTCQSKLCTLP